MPIIRQQVLMVPTRYRHEKHRGVSLIELIVFIVIVSIALTALLAVYIQSSRANVDPIIRVRLLEAAQSRLDEVIALKYDEATPSGGIPACSSGDPAAVACTNSPEGNMDDVDDFHNHTDVIYSNYNRTVRVTTANNRKLISVTVTAPNGQALTLSAYRYNF